MPDRRTTAGTIQALANGLEVLEAIAGRDQPVSLSDLAREMNMSKSGMYRVLATLCECKYVTQDAASSHYSLTDHMLQISQQRDRSLDLRMTSRPHLSHLRDLTGETTHLAMPVGTQMVYVDKFESAHSLRMASSVGDRIQMHSTALGKCYLAFADGSRLNQLLATIDMPSKTSATITSPDQLRAELDRTRARGYSIDDIENEEGVRCVGAPVFGRDSSVIACISVSGPATRLSRAVVDQVGTACRETADAINQALGSPSIKDIAQEREHETR